MRWAPAIATLIWAVLLVGASSALAGTVPAWPAASELTLPSNAPTPTNAGNQSISCTSTDNCVAVGWYYPASGVSEPMAATETDGTWGQASELTLPANAGTTSGQAAAMAGVSCSSPGDCAAVGAYGDSSGSPHAMVSSETDGTWGQSSEVTLPPDASTSTPAAHLFAVSCTTADDCIAVGDYQNSSNRFEPLVVTETDAGWQATTLTLPADAGTQQGSSLRGVSCTSAGNCTAVGFYSNSSESEPMVATETDGSWGNAVSLAAPPSRQGGALFAVACTSAGDCGAVGDDGNPSGLMVATETAGVWEEASQLTLPSNANAAGQVRDFGGISCTSPGSCVVVGQYQDASDHGEPLVAAETGGAWGQTSEMMLPANSSSTLSNQGGDMYGISCTGPGECAAGGIYLDTGGTNQAMAVNSVASLSLPNTTLPSALVGTAYHAQLWVEGGTGSRTWSVVSGSLPAGLRLTSGGTISGTPTSAGTKSFTVTISDPGPPEQQARETLSIAVNPAPVHVVSAQFANQTITVTTPSACVAPWSRMLVTFDSTKRAGGAKLRFVRVAFYIDRGVRHEITRRIDGRRRVIAVYRPTAISRHQPVHVELSVAKLKPTGHRLRVVVRYVKVVRQHGHESTVTVVKRLRDGFSVC